MSDGTPRLELPLIQQSQAQKHVTHNEALAILDLLVQLVVQDFGVNTPPGSPQDGQVWALGGAPTGAWAGQASMLAARINGGWEFIAPQPGWRAVGLVDGSLRRWTGSDWLQPALDLSNMPGVGVNASFDETNRLVVSALATLLTHEGAGHQLKINKAAAGDTASLLFQTDWSGRAEMGTAGNDDFTVKVSPDGSAWHEALVLDRTNGNAVMKQLQAEALTGTAVTQSDTDTTEGRVMRTGHRVYPALISHDTDTDEVGTEDKRVVIASELSRTTGFGSVVLGCGSSEANATWASVISTFGVSVNTGRSTAIACREGGIVAPGQMAAMIACGGVGSGSILSGTNVIAACGRRFINNQDRSFAMGDAASGDALTANRKIHMFSETGNIQIAGSLTSSHTFSDFAEMFPNATGVEIPLGTIVTEEGGAVRPAGPGDEIAGVVTATAVVTAGDTPFAWQGRYLSDEWGQPVMEQIPDPDHEGEGPAPLIWVRKENPEWNPEAMQVPRSERPEEWTRVGLLGQVFTRVAEGVVPGDRLSAVDGIGVKSSERTGLRCMVITQPYDAAKGYAVARCLINFTV